MPDISDTAYSEVDASNNQAPPNGWPEGMMPAAVNDVARQNMGAYKRFWNRINAVRTSTGSAPNYLIATDNVTYPTAYVNGEVWAFKAHRASGGGDTLGINSLGPKALYHMSPSVAQIGAGEIPAGQVVLVAYDATLNAGAGGWQVLASGAADKVAKSGDTMTGGLTITAGGLSVTGLATFNSNMTCGNVTASGDVNCLNANGGEATFTGFNANGGGSAITAYAGSIVGGNIVVYSLGGGTGYKPGGGVWADNSDRRLKKNVADYTAGLAEVTQLQPVSFEFNGRGETADNGKTYVGLIADDAQLVMPEMIGTRSVKLDPDTEPVEVLTLEATALIYALVNSVKELSARVAELEFSFRVSDWRLLEYDPETGVRHDYWYDESNDRCVIRRSEDVEPLLEANKRLANDWDGWNGDRSMRLAARVTPAVQMEWLQKYGVRAWDKNHKRAVQRLLNSNEYRYLRIGHFII